MPQECVGQHAAKNFNEISSQLRQINSHIVARKRVHCRVEESANRSGNQR